MTKRILVWLVILLITEIILAKISATNFETRLESYLSSQTQSLEIQYNTIFDTYRITAKTLYNECLNKEEILSIFAKAKHANKAEQKILRDSLYYILKPTYNRMEEADYRQLHFHFSNNVSFLRFHRPSKFGDDLTTIRSTVANANESKQYTEGFEEGRIFNGFRYVFPLFHNNQHIGTVETSISFNAIRKKLLEQHKAEYWFIIKKDVVNTKVFKSEKSNYRTCSLSDKYMFEEKLLKEIDDNNFMKTHKDAISLMKKSFKGNALETKLAAGESFSFQINGNQTESYVVSFCPIHNYKNKQVAYFFSISENSFIPQWQKGAKIKTLFNQFLTFLLILSFAAILEYTIRLKQQKRDLKKMIQAKDNFFSIISHDIRGPLGTFNELLNIILRNYNNQNEEKRKKQLQVLSNESLSIYKLFENLLSWSSLQRGSMEFSPIDIGLLELVEKIGFLMKLALKNKNINFSITIHPDLVVFADENMLELTVRNLVSNAIKFTPTGGAISIEATEVDHFIQLSVKDTGVGISQEGLSKIFRIDKKYSTDGTNSEKGTGLGLLLCKEFIEKHGSNLRVETEIMKGTCFCFNLEKGSKLSHSI